MSGEVADEWASITLKEAAGELFTDGDWVESKDQDPDGEVRLIQLADIGDGLFLDKSARFLTADKARELRCTFLRPGDLLVARMADPIARCCLFPGIDQPAATVVDVSIVRPGPDVDREYLAYAISNPVFRSEALGSASGTTRSRISRSNLGAISLPLPPLDEQRRIAEVLRSVDEAIAAGAAVVASARALLASAGREVLRSADEEPTEGEQRFALLDICRPKQHPIIGKAELTESGYPVYGANGQIGYCNSYTHAQPVIAITCRGATCGTVNWVPAKSYVTGNAMALDQLDRRRIDERFLFHYVSTWGVDRSISGSAQPQITRQSLSCVDIIAPDLDRQREIADALDAIEDQVRAASSAFEATKSVKTALMSDLLSGRVRVPA